MASDYVTAIPHLLHTHEDTPIETEQPPAAETPAPAASTNHVTAPEAPAPIVPTTSTAGQPPRSEAPEPQSAPPHHHPGSYPIFPPAGGLHPFFPPTPANSMQPMPLAHIPNGHQMSSARLQEAVAFAFTGDSKLGIEGVPIDGQGAHQDTTSTRVAPAAPEAEAPGHAGSLGSQLQQPEEQVGEQPQQGGQQQYGGRGLGMGGRGGRFSGNVR